MTVNDDYLSFDDAVHLAAEAMGHTPDPVMRQHGTRVLFTPPKGGHVPTLAPVIVDRASGEVTRLPTLAWHWPEWVREAILHH